MDTNLTYRLFQNCQDLYELFFFACPACPRKSQAGVFSRGRGIRGPIQEIPKPKSEITNKNQTSNIKSQMAAAVRLEHWNLWVWSLSFDFAQDGELVEPFGILDFEFVISFVLTYTGETPKGPSINRREPTPCVVLSVVRLRRTQSKDLAIDCLRLSA
jgi:hypothetical protein